VNVPRLLRLAGDGALSPSTKLKLRSGFPRGETLIRELVEIENTLRQMSIRAVDVKEIDDPKSEVQEGLVICYHQRVRTKNAASKDVADVQNYSFARSPLIYLDSHGYRYIQPYDPVWITTSTAQGTVRSGNCMLAGIAIVKAVNHADREVIASPLTFGIPNLFDF